MAELTPKTEKLLIEYATSILEQYDKQELINMLLDSYSDWDLLNLAGIEDYLSNKEIVDYIEDEMSH